MQRRIQAGRGPGVPLISRPNWGPKGRNKFFWRPVPRQTPPPPPPPIPLSHGLDPPLKCTKPKRFLNYFTFYKPKWKNFPIISYTSRNEIPTLSYTWSLKQIPLSGGASPHRSLKGVAPGWSLLLLLFHVALFVFPKNLTLASHIF